MSRLTREWRADLVRLTGGASPARIAVAALTRRCYRPLFTLRLAQACDRSGAWRVLRPLTVLLHRVARHAASMDLPWSTAIGEGVRIDHGYSLVVNAGARIGGNVTLFHGVTLGQSDRIAADGTRVTGYPTIEDDVWVGPHAMIVGDVTIGRGSRIAGGALVTQSVPPHSLVMGNPAKVVRENVVPDVDNPWSPVTAPPAASSAPPAARTEAAAP